MALERHGLDAGAAGVGMVAMRVVKKGQKGANQNFGFFFQTFWLDNKLGLFFTYLLERKCVESKLKKLVDLQVTQNVSTFVFLDCT